MQKEVILQDATRNQLIKELFSRESITSVQVNGDEGATIITKFGKISVSGESNIFVIEPNFIDPLCSPLEKLNIGGNTVEFNAKENSNNDENLEDESSLQLKLLEISATLIKLFNENKKENTTTDNSDVKTQPNTNPNNSTLKNMKLHIEVKNLDTLSDLLNKVEKVIETIEVIVSNI